MPIIQVREVGKVKKKKNTCILYLNGRPTKLAVKPTSV